MGQPTNSSQMWWTDFVLVFFLNNELIIFYPTTFYGLCYCVCPKPMVVAKKSWPNLIIRKAWLTDPAIAQWTKKETRRKTGHGLPINFHFFSFLFLLQVPRRPGMFVAASTLIMERSLFSSKMTSAGWRSREAAAAAAAPPESGYRRCQSKIVFW